MPVIKEQFLSALADKESPDRPLVMPVVYGLAARLNGCSLHSYLTSAQILADCQLATSKRLGFDAVYAYADNSVDAEALGAELDWPEGLYPRVVRPVLAAPEDVDALLPAEPATAGRRREILKACGYLRQAVGTEKLVVGVVFGPFSLAGQLLGLEKLLFLLVDEPSRFERLIAKISPFVNAYAEALAAAGTGILMLYEPAASPAVVNREVFLRYLQPLYREMLTTWAALRVPIGLHIVGPVKRCLAEIAQLPTDLVMIDDSVPWDEARRAFPRAYLVGNLSAPMFASAGAGQIVQAVHAARLQADWRTILGSDCELPLDSKLENLKALTNWR